MSINLEKGSKINLKKLNLCLGWDTRMDLDAFAILLKALLTKVVP